MTPTKLKIGILVVASLAFSTYYFSDEGVVDNQDLIATTNSLNDNDPAYMSGCQTHHGPVAPKVIYPTVNKNYVTRLCALEVPPSNVVIAKQRATWGREN